jgi:SPP1 gp7 family putative phage head morphogenesis protein
VQLEAINEREREALLAAVFEIPKVSNPLAESFLADATNRLVAIGDVVWYTARGEMLTGMQLGEGVAELRERVVASAKVSQKRAEVIARTEVNSAMNNGAYEQMKALDVATVKEWIATNDSRTRESHEEVDGEEIDGDAKFMVGGFPMAHPHDLDGPPSETINCRCTLAWEIVDDEDDYEDVLVASTVKCDSFHLPGRHEQKNHGNRKGKTAGGAGHPTTKAASLSDILKSDAITKLLDDPDAFDYSSKKTEDRILGEIVKQRGFDAKPELVDTLPSGGTAMGRAVTDRDYAQQFLTGDYFAGKGQFGNGTYFIQTNDSGQLDAVTSIYGDHKIRAALTPSAKTVSLADLQDEMKTLVADAEKEEQETYGRAMEYFQRGDAAGFERDYGRARRRAELLRDPGRAAALLGYDAILVTRDSEQTEVVVLNRGAVQAERGVK